LRRLNQSRCLHLATIRWAQARTPRRFFAAQLRVTGPKHTLAARYSRG